MLTKQCSKCGQNKPTEQYQKYKNKEGLKTICKNCVDSYNHSYYKKNKKYINEQNKKWRKEHSEQDKKIHQKWRIENKEHMQEYFCNLHIKNREKRNEYRRQDYKKKSEQYKRNVRNYRKTEVGKNNKKQSDAKRDRDKKWIPILPNIFPTDISIAWHHIEGKWFVVPIPLILHKGGPNLKKHIEEVNSWVEFYYTMNPIDFLDDKII